MKPALLLVILALASACARGPETPPLTSRSGERPTPEPAAVAAPTPTPSKPSPQPGNVTLAEPADGQPVLANPFRLAGTARTFENHVSIRIRDEKNQTILETWTTAVGDLGNFNPWEKEVLLTSYPGATITVEVFESSAKDGAIQSLVSRTLPFRVPPKDVTIYLHDPSRAPDDCSRTFPVQRQVPATRSIARALIEALIRAPGGPFPEGSAVEKITVADGVATVDFNDRLRNVGGSCRAQAIRASVERTLTDLPAVDRVVITASGSSKLALQP